MSQKSSAPQQRRSVSRVLTSDMLEEYAVRVQESVFEARLTGRAAAALFAELEGWLAPGDSLRMYAVSAAGLARSRSAGGAPVPEDAPYWIV